MHVLNSMLSVLNLTLPNQQMFNILWNAAKDHKVIEPVVHMVSACTLLSHCFILQSDCNTTQDLQTVTGY
jgi:hypothetical protein